MKKSLILLTIVLVLITSISLAACGGGVAPQLALTAPWNDFSEKSTYDVYENYGSEKNEKKLGNLVVTYEMIDGVKLDASEKFKSSDFDNLTITPSFTQDEFYGYVIVTKLTLDDGQYKRSILVADKHYKAKYSYAKSHFTNKENTFDDVETEIKYEDKKCTVTTKGKSGEDNIDITNTIKYKPYGQTAYFDNAFYIALTRVLVAPGAQKQISFLTPSIRDNKMMKRVATASTQRIEIKDEKIDISKFVQPEDKKEKNSLTCYKHVIASGETMPGSGTPISYLVSAVPYQIGEDKHMNVLVKFVEHDMTYILKDIEYTKVIKK